MKAPLDSLDEEIKKELENFNAEVINAANDSFRETAKEAAEMLKKADRTRKEPEHTQKIGRLTSEEAGQA